MANAFIVAGDAATFEEFLAEFGSEFLFCAVDPAAAEAQLVCHEHHVAEGERAVVCLCAVAGFCGNDEGDGCAVERVGIAAEGCVDDVEFFEEFFVGDGDDDGRLHATARGSVEASLDNFVDEFFRHWIGFEAAAAAPFFHEV